MSINSLNSVTSTNGQIANLPIKQLEEEQSARIRELIETEESASNVNQSDKTKEDIEAELKELNKEKATLEKKIELIQEHVEELTAEAVELYEKAIDEQKDLSDEQKAESKKITDEEVKKYVDSCKKSAEKGEKGASRSELSANIQSALKSSNLSYDIKFANVMRDLAESNEMFDEIDNQLDAVRGYALDLQAIDMDIANANSALEDIKEKEACEPPPTCDPMGFVAQDGTQYDFVVAGENGTLDSTSEFLGAEDQWEAMKKLDTDGDNIVTAQELEAGGVSVVANKGNKAQDISNTFGNLFSIDLNSYKSGANQEVAGVSAGNSDNDEYADQELLGTFQVNMGDGSKITGYNTLDDVDYLQEEYNIEVDTEQKTASELPSGFEWVDEAQETSNFFKTKISEAYEEIGLDESEIETLQGNLRGIADEQANVIRNKFNLMAEKFVSEQEALEEEAAQEETAGENQKTAQTYSVQDGVVYVEENGEKTPATGKEGETITINGKTYVFDGESFKLQEDDK